MAEADWTQLTGTALDTAAVPRGVSAAFTRPYCSGSNNFCFGFRSSGADVGFAGYYVNVTNFSPITGTCKGGSLRAVIKKYSSGLTYAPMFGLIKGTDPATAEGYLLGLSEAASFKIVCKKGTPLGLSADGSYILSDSQLSYTNTGDAMASWFHLRMDILVNPHGEVVLDFFRNTLTATNVPGVSGPIDDPEWLPITGMTTYIDDSIGVLSGSLPHLDGFYAVFGHYTSNCPGAVSLFDHIEVFRQTAP